MADKCFCHLNGYEVKDAAARNSIQIIERVFNDNTAAIAALRQELVDEINNTVAYVDAQIGAALEGSY